ncbi:glycosyltransferase family 4 protein [Dactylosporangium matsuzakiense]|uniref:Glycosyl transferase n=1 Tax=Dactylosporangium matsuzakiense TaxID=53360 RepID=A0A9W6NQG1_9ACTN|nr:glycosyltransferase family 4 protein [Dactylosporangium matsuzakiense]UWZ42333.1 glycosyltransferase family 4 protein [Dactylosporangium matsuzakiense]GLL05293.1 glycosyl transferase [Dactylosporangium matsuzakiense]
MRILVCNWKDLRHPRAGGAEVYTHEIARRWVAAGHEVTLCCAAVDGAPSIEDVDGVCVVRRGSRMGVYRAARDYYRGAGSGRFDVVVDEVNTRPFGCPAWAGTTPVVALIHQVCREIWRYEMPLPVALLGRYVLEPAWLRRYRDVRVLTVSASSRDSLRRYGLRDVTVVPAGVVHRPRPDVSREAEPTVVFLGRLAGNKRPLAALAAFHRLRARMPAAQMWFIGDGPQRAALAAAAGPGVTLFGRVGRAERDELLARAHVLVVTSVREGWGLVVDEAAAMGTPTVGYDRPGLRDSVPAAGGVLVEPTPAALAAALERGLPAWTAASARHGWRGGATDWDTVAAAVLDQIIAGDGARHPWEAR